MNFCVLGYFVLGVFALAGWVWAFRLDNELVQRKGYCERLEREAQNRSWRR